MEDRGPFDRILQPEPASRPDRTAVVVAALAVAIGVLLLILVLPPVAIFSGESQAAFTGQISVNARDQSPSPPSGFEAVSQLFDLVSTQPVRQEVPLTVPLSITAHPDDPLYLFTYANKRWQQLGTATAVGNGTAARGNAPALPENVAVFRKAGSARSVAGFLPAGADLDPQAAGSLTTIMIGGFSPDADGRVTGNGPALPADVTVPVEPVLSAGGPDQTANLNAILASPDLRSAHVQAISGLVRDGQYAGIDLDYRAIDPANGESFTALVTDLANVLRAEDKALTLTLPVPVQTTDSWDTYGFNWRALAPLVDNIVLANGPDQDVYYQQIEDALGYLVPLVGGSKLLIATSPLSHERAPDGVHELTLTDALTEASAPTAQPSGAVAPGAAVQASAQNLSTATGGSTLHWDETARAVTFSYTGAGGQHTVWLSNVFSEAFELELAQRYELGGVAIDDVSTRGADANVWPAVQEYTQTGKVTLTTPNGSLLQPSWSADGGTLQSAAGDTVTWQSPSDPGSYTLTLVVSDGVTRVGQQLQLSVQSPAAAGGQ